jgi:hypothetical protein
VVEAAEVGARCEDTWFQEGFYDFREATGGVGGWVEEFAAEACKVRFERDEGRCDRREGDDERRAKIGFQAVEETFEMSELEGFFDVQVYAVQLAGSDEVSKRLVVGFKLWVDGLLAFTEGLSV